MHNQQAQQRELDFNAAPSCSGYNGWIEQREKAVKELARQLGLPLNHEVELWLRGGICLRGKLIINEERLFVPETRDMRISLRIDKATFSPADIESCVRMD